MFIMDPLFQEVLSSASNDNNIAYTPLVFGTIMKANGIFCVWIHLLPTRVIATKVGLLHLLWYVVFKKNQSLMV